MNRLMGLILLMLLVSHPLLSQDLTGYFKNFSIAVDLPPGLASEGLLWQVSNRARFKYNHRFDPHWKLETAWDLSPRFQHAYLFRMNQYGFALNPSSYRVADLDRQLYPRSEHTPGHFGLYQNLDRLSVTWSTDKADFVFGRQAIAWGSARVVSPTDVIAPFVFNELDKEEVFGVDAVWIRIPTGRLNEVDLGYVFGRHLDFDESAFFLRNRMSVANTDVAFQLTEFRNHLLLGFDVSRALGQMGFNLEAAYVDTGCFDRSLAGHDYLRLSVGLDHSLTDRLYGYAEYHYNSAGGSDPAAYRDLFQQPAYRVGSVYLVGRHYLSLGCNLQLTPLNNLVILGIGNLQDQSISLWPRWEYNMTTNSYVSLGANVGIGKRPIALQNAGHGLLGDFRSEFGAYPNVVYTSFRFYF